MKRQAKSQIDAAWIDQIKDSWKSLYHEVRDAEGVDDVTTAVKNLKNWISLLREDIMINKALWSMGRPGMFSTKREPPEETKFKKKVTQLLDDVETSVEEARLRLQMLSTATVTHDEATINMLIGNVREIVSEADRNFSRKLIPHFRRELKKVESLDFGEFIPDEVDLGGGVKLVFDDRLSENPRQLMREFEHTGDPSLKIKSPERRTRLVDGLQEARSMLRRKGMDHLWYGNIVVSPISTEGHYARYNVSLDKLEINSLATIRQDHMPYTVIHELGHRHWYKFMTRHDRQAFSAYFETGEVDPVTDYGGTMAEEDFAEVFAHYITGKPMGRDQLERFKTFFGDKISSTMASSVALKGIFEHLVLKG